MNGRHISKVFIILLLFCEQAFPEALLPPQGATKESRGKDMQACFGIARERWTVDEDDKLLLGGRATTGFLWQGSLSGPKPVEPSEDGAIIPADSLFNAFRSNDATDRYVLCFLNRGYRWEKAAGTPVDEIRIQAEKGDILAQSALGSMYFYGRGVKQDMNEAISWYRKAAEQGYAKAQFNLGMAYSEGDGVPKSYMETLSWMRKAAAKGHPQARALVAGMEKNGLGAGPEKFDAAEVERNRKAAEAGDKEAQYAVGWYYEDGIGVTQDISQAISWFRKAAEAGHSPAQLQLGVIYDHARGGVRQDDQEAIKWYRLSAEGGNAQAQYNVGVMLSLGRGVEKNEAEGGKWIEKALANGYRFRR